MERSIKSVIGNESLCERLISDVANGSLSHTYILEGESGSGRKTIALNVAAATACVEKGNANASLPCGKCPSCQKILAKKSTDVIFISNDDKATIGVDIARFLREDVRVIPNDIEDKFYIIDNADKLTDQAQNALLLTLEEPPSFVHFFLICNKSESLMETVRSRAITLRTDRLNESCIADYICSADSRAAQLKLSSPKEFSELIKASNSSIGQALEFLEPSVWKPIRERRENIRELIDASFSKKSAKTIIPLLMKFSSKRDLLTEKLNLLALAVRDLILVKKSDNASLEFYCDINEAIELSDRVTLSFIYNFYKNIETAIEETARNANVSLLLSKMMINSELL